MKAPNPAIPSIRAVLFIILVYNSVFYCVFQVLFVFWIQNSAPMYALFLSAGTRVPISFSNATTATTMNAVNTTTPTLGNLIIRRIRNSQVFKCCVYK